MTLNEAIKHCEEKAKELGCTKCGKEHAQLAEWLKELQRYRFTYSVLLDKNVPTSEDLCLQKKI